jgi:hypothetical protein
MWTTTGNLTNVKTNAKFDFGVAMLPAGKRRGTPTGGGNFYLFKKSTPQQREAALRFVRWITSPERAAQWGIDTGYVAVRADAWDTPVMTKYVQGFPQAAVARDQLQVRGGRALDARQPARHQGAERRLQAALTGAKTPEAAMKDAQREAERFSSRIASSARLKNASRPGPRLAAAAAGRGPARRVHALPGGRDAVEQLLLDGQAEPPAAFSGLDNYRRWRTTRCSGSRSRTTAGSRSARSRLDRARAADGGVGQRQAARPRFLRLAYFTPTVLPMIAVANIWLFFYTPQYGLLEQLTRLVRLPQLARQPVHGACLPGGGRDLEGAGFFMIFYLAALQAVPPNLYEAARIEGASRWTMFRRITFPLLMPTTLFVLVNAVINSFRWSTTSW